MATPSIRTVKTASFYCALVVLVCSLSVALLNHGFVFADDQGGEAVAEEHGHSHEHDHDHSHDGEKKEELEQLSEAQRNALFLMSIRDEIALARKEYSSIGSNVGEFQEKAGELKEKRLTLASQLSRLDAQIATTRHMIANVHSQVSRKEGEISQVLSDIEAREVELNEQKRILVEYLELVYSQKNEFMELEEEEANAVKLLFSDDSVGTILQNLRYYSFLEDTGHQIVKRIAIIKTLLEGKHDELKEHRARLKGLTEVLNEERARLTLQKSAKKTLLKETQGKEEIFQELVSQSKKEQELILKEIATLQSNLRFVEKKMAEYGEYFEARDYEKLINDSVDAIYGARTKGLARFRWPVNPKLGISAYFRDPSYKRALGVVHNAIDMPIIQGSPIRSAGDGVVYRAKDNGMGYSYIMVAHKDGYMTLYGHMYEIHVKNGDPVRQGEIIGLSGGMPGTRGAGHLTTGAHLHFEIFKNGKHIDPLTELPLVHLPLRFVPEKYLDTLRVQQENLGQDSEEDAAEDEPDSEA